MAGSLISHFSSYLSAMFDLFRKKENPVPVSDRIWMNDKGKENGLLQLVNANPDIIVAAWFDDTVAATEQFLKTSHPDIAVYSYRQLHSAVTAGKEIVFTEHYPLYNKEQEVFRSLQAAKIIVLSSLEEPLLKHFGGDRMAAMMRTLGGTEEEAISHSLISRSLQKAQQKIEKSLVTEQAAASVQEWFRKNVRS